MNPNLTQAMHDVSIRQNGLCMPNII